MAWRRASGGAWLDGGGQGGLLAISPAMDCPGSADRLSTSKAAPTVECPLDVWAGNARHVPATVCAMPNLAAHVLSRSVRAIAAFQSHLVMGGSFLGHTTNALDYLVSWDGAKVEPLGAGLDGTVYALTNFRDLLVVAGSFSQLYQGKEGGGKSLASGGLGVWDGHQWGLLGHVPVQGSVTCLAVTVQEEALSSGGQSNAAQPHASAHLLYIAGRFGRVGSVAASNIAVYNHLTQSWKALGRGLRARDVFALTVAPGFGDQGHSLFAVGSISHAGDVLVGNVARWRASTQSWHPMRNVNGIVRAAAVMHSRLYIGGDFSVAGDQPAAAIAYTDLDQRDSGNTSAIVWHQLGVGVQGNVHVLRGIAGCMYVGGRIDSVGDYRGIKAANNIARWCVRSRTSEPLHHHPRWEPVKGLDTSGGTVLAIAAADVTLGSDLLP